MHQKIHQKLVQLTEHISYDKKVTKQKDCTLMVTI